MTRPQPANRWLATSWMLMSVDYPAGSRTYLRRMREHLIVEARLANVADIYREIGGGS